MGPLRNNGMEEMGWSSSKWTTPGRPRLVFRRCHHWRRAAHHVALQPGRDHHCRGTARRPPHVRCRRPLGPANVGVTGDRGRLEDKGGSECVIVSFLFSIWRRQIFILVIKKLKTDALLILSANRRYSLSLYHYDMIYNYILSN